MLPHVVGKGIRKSRIPLLVLHSLLLLPTAGTACVILWYEPDIPVKLKLRRTEIVMANGKPKEGVKSENSDHTNLKVKKDGSGRQFKIKGHALLSK